jgi:hypothetical protein
MILEPPPGLEPQVQEQEQEQVPVRIRLMEHQQQSHNGEKVVREPGLILELLP